MLIQTQSQLKDSVLDQIAEIANVAQFASFDPDLKHRHLRIRGVAAGHQFDSVGATVEELLRSAGSVNVRTFDPHNDKSREFIYGLMDPQQVTTEVSRLALLGLFTIINETIDVNDGGVSGVALGNLIEFAPGDTPRCVEKPGTLALPRNLATPLLERVYGFPPDLDHYRPSERIEFSVHPLKRGLKNDHTIIWEVEEVGSFESEVDIIWPNRFSRFIGDKAFGLLLADTLGFRVPATTVFPRSLPPFTFGRRTGSGETWIRTCPAEPDPGRYATHKGWLDPFELLAREDPDGKTIASVLAQEGVNATHSGSLIVERDGSVTIEGVSGYGDDFMLGRSSFGSLPGAVTDSVLQLYRQVAARLGPVRFEWVHDGENAWIVQLHKGATMTLGFMIYPGEPEMVHRFEVHEGIDSLRKLIKSIGSGEGITIVGEIGVTSHFGDLLRKAKIPSKIETKTS